MKQKKRLLLNSTFIATLIVAFFILQTIGCKKDEASTPPATYSIEGLWIGTFEVDGQPELGQQYFSLIIKPDGTMINDTKFTNKQHLAIGPWTLTGDSFSCVATCVYGYPTNIGVVENHTAIFDKTTGKLTNGVWKNVPPLTGSGTFVLTKVK